MFREGLNDDSLQRALRKTASLSSASASSNRTGHGTESSDSRSDGASSHVDSGESSSDGESDSSAAAFEELAKYLQGAKQPPHSTSSAVGTSSEVWSRACALPEGNLLETPLVRLSYGRESLGGGVCRLVLTWKNPSNTSLLRIDA